MARSPSKSDWKRHPAVQRLLEFFADMNRWEWEMIREDTSDLADLEEDAVYAEMRKRRQASRDRLAAIFAKHCEVGAEAKRVSDVLHWGSDEPDYNPKRERVLSVTERGGKVIVETQMAHNFGFRLRYELVKIGGDWRIRDNRKHMQDGTGKWSRWDL